MKHSGNEVIVIIGGFAGKFSVVTPRPKLVVVSCLLMIKNNTCSASKKAGHKDIKFTSIHACASE